MKKKLCEKREQKKIEEAKNNFISAKTQSRASKTDKKIICKALLKRKITEMERRAQQKEEEKEEKQREKSERNCYSSGIQMAVIRNMGKIAG